MPRRVQKSDGAINVRMLLSRSGVSDTATSYRSTFSRPSAARTSTATARSRATRTTASAGRTSLLFQESFEHSLGDWPVGVWIASDQGRVSLQDDKGEAGTFRTSIGAGLTLRAGGFPVVTFSWATGGSEGHHVAITINSSLLGASARPSLN